jgi:hypothetical protein
MDDVLLTLLIAKAVADGLADAETKKAQEGILISKCLPIQKAWTDDAGVTHIEGWISTEDQDIERDVVPPESFTDAVDGYMALGAPITSEHQLKPMGGEMVRYPVGHMQAVALVRDGQVLKAGKHPSDPAEFEHFPGVGTGVYGRGILTDELASTQVAKGNVRGFSWVGMVRSIERLPGGGRKFLRIDPWRESTIAAFPVNTKAVLVAAQ